MSQIAIDIGGTFTDVACLDDGGRLVIAKVPTTPHHLVEGVLAGARKALDLAGLDPASVTRFIHSTTIATNAILQERGAVTALLLTEGFEDILEVGRQKRTEMYDNNIGPETPAFLAPRRLRAGIRERIGPDGKVIQPLDEGQLIAAVGDLVDRFDVEAVAICYLFAFLDDRHERRSRELIGKHFPKLKVSISSEVNPVFREYERCCVTAFDAYVRPAVSDYIQELAAGLGGIGVNAELQVMQSRGGITNSGIVAEKPVTMLLSGPAAGVVGSQSEAALSGFSDLITVDIGGTSCDVALVTSGKPLISREGQIRNYPVRISMVDVNTIGAGGGSYAWIDDAGGLHVGPQSAGSDPGPICYNRGGTMPTVTDASVVLGYLNPEYFGTGELSLDKKLAWDGIAAMAARLSMTPEVLAAGIHRIVNERMANEIRLVSVRRGYDPRNFSLVGLGGAGPVHGGRLASSLSIPRMIVPAAPGVLCAFGLLAANIEHEQTRTLGRRLDEADPAEVAAMFADLDRLCEAKMRRENVDMSRVEVTHLMDMRYVGQSYELEVPTEAVRGRAELKAAILAYNELHGRIYGYTHPEAVEAINLRSVFSFKGGRPPVETAPAGGRRAEGYGHKGTRRAYFEELGGYVDTPLYDRARLTPDVPIAGPAIIEQPDTTTVVYPGQVATGDWAGNVIVVTGAEQAS
ncbi:hydantoinase/oxoprolinase family protein [Bosea sp. (in: a-proteobacteria)]|uniref:hydantoinase/oxoprolinase family protein n=1 Tax=Bosea sp. (in: a-proteobacteria) TaxID=1871050 RepID=UPI002630D697|nr:hydantoinase/oxoprolinase family protein [Bosea sp. (in: a-proteobacteria)]MCO5089554.1 hydantoinase/oxoprolinase family protein [Bosea sp. (in: a-proteobacteria)]